MRFAPNLSLLFTEYDYLDRPAAAAAAGFDAVETWWPFNDAAPLAAEVDAFIAALATAKVELVQMNIFAGDLASGERGVLSVPGREAELVSSARVARTVAERTGCQRFNTLYGQCQPEHEQTVQDVVAFRNLEAITEMLAPVGGVVLLEPLTTGQNGAYPLATDDDVFAVIDRTGLSGVSFLADLFHLANNGVEAVEMLGRWGSGIGYIQIADTPGRHEPGTGALPWSQIFAAIKSSSYSAPIALEYHPLAGTADGLGWMTGPI